MGIIIVVIVIVLVSDGRIFKPMVAEEDDNGELAGLGLPVWSEILRKSIFLAIFYPFMYGSPYRI